jgi:hypothetical protein
VILRETKLLERRARGDLDLRSDDVDAGDLLSDGMFDLNARVDFSRRWF